jgi:hypothetical protein
LKRTNTLSLKVLLDEFVSQKQLGARLTEARIISTWKEIAVPFADASIRWNRGMLYIHINSPALRHELFMQRTELLRLLNAKLGEPLVDQIIVK